MIPTSSVQLLRCQGTMSPKWGLLTPNCVDGLWYDRETDNNVAIALVIDDNRLMADSLCQMINFFGVEARPAYGPRAAMISLNQYIPDIVFCDIRMPGVDGFEVQAYLRRMQWPADVPVVFITIDDQVETARKAIGSGAVMVMVKPGTLNR